MPWKDIIEKVETHLRGLRDERGVWPGRLSSSALSTATAMVALHEVDAAAQGGRIAAGARWLAANQNSDGGWGDTTISKSNLSTTLLCWSALRLCEDEGEGEGENEDEDEDEDEDEEGAAAVARAEGWIRAQVGSLEPEAMQRAVVARYGKDKTFSVPILMLCAICGTLGSGETAWRRVLPLPFELAALPRGWFGAIGLPVVSYALPALIAIGHARFYHAPPAWWNPLRGLRAALWPRIRPLLKTLQPSSGGYLEATPLTSFVTMALAASGEREHPCVAAAVAFLRRSMREDGSWPIDTNLATWGTTLAVKSGVTLNDEERRVIGDWLLGQQYREVHPFTNAAPGGWAWTDLPGGVPDADDTPGALLALHRLGLRDERTLEAVAAGTRWLLDLQNRDGGMPTFCRGWGTLPFDRSTPELTAHALAAWRAWAEFLPGDLRGRVERATDKALAYLIKQQRQGGCWTPLWFGNENARDEENPVYGTAQVVNYLCAAPETAERAAVMLRRAGDYLLRCQRADGSWGGDGQSVERAAGSPPSSLEETAVCVQALAALHDRHLLEEAPGAAMQRGAEWLAAATADGTRFPAAPIGLYFARLWYHEELYPVLWTLGALRVVK